MASASYRYGLAEPKEAAGLTGLEFLHAIIEGRLPHPPICEILNFRLTEAGTGQAVFTGETGSALLNPMGGVHGGWAMTLIDSAAGCAGHTLLPAGSGYTTVETKVNFTAPIAADAGALRCDARVVAAGRRVITAEARLSDSRGRICAHGSSTLLILEPRP
ncbi:PaaI family thioesterase [Marinicauda algicola]|uniref:PaaI family thioesterase n=1 Tax=Marinicauda algicola TaxID=2029849 RepID=A0A4S2H3Q3_9PROT|nr:PaaI family thioesterase [Marinicauda algicola]TGY90216.1 PaaI family thioesterase [Marinicauda algicola]